MSSVQRHPSGRWRARWRSADGSSRSRVFDRLSDAKAFLTDVDHELSRGTYTDRRAGQRVTFADYATDWLKLRSCRPQSAALAAQQLRDHAFPQLGARPIGAVRHSEIVALVAALSRTLAPTTTAVVFGRVRAVFRSAVKDGLIPRSPCDDVRPPQRPTTGGRVDHVLSVEQVSAIADAMPAHLRAAVIVGATTGLRAGELFGLTLPAVDFLRRRLQVERQLVRPRGQAGGVELVEILKTPHSRRSIPLGDVTIEALARHLEEFDPHPDLGLIFTDHRGRPLREQTFSRAWHDARQAAGVPVWAKGPHSLRHHYASLLISSGASPVVVQRRLGHASPSFTLSIYGHLWGDDDDLTRDALDAAWLTPGSGVTSVAAAP